MLQQILLSFHHMLCNYGGSSSGGISNFLLHLHHLICKKQAIYVGRVQHLFRHHHRRRRSYILE